MCYPFQLTGRLTFTPERVVVPRSHDTMVSLPRAPVAQLVEQRAVTRKVVSSTPAGLTLRVFK